MKSFSDYIIDIDALKNNLLEYKKLDKNSKICVVAKADGYGIGIENVVCALDDYADFYAVACFVEAVKLRQITQKPILVLNFVDKNNLNFCAENNISITASNLKQLEKIKKSKQKVKVHLAINTGMNRIGFLDMYDFENALRILHKYKNTICLEGVFTHFYNANNRCTTKKQFDIFMQYISILEKYFDVSKIIKHASSSVASIKYPEFRLDMVRLGICLYQGLKNIRGYSGQDVVSIKSKIVNIQKIKKGDAVGYANGYIAKKSKTIATIPLGYADGIFRIYAKNGYVLCGGQKCKILGNICMDMFMIDITNASAKLFDKVTLLGTSKNKKISLNEFAKNSSTISYEILTSIKRTRFNTKIKGKRNKKASKI